MTLIKSQSKNSTSLYITKCVRENGRRTTKIIEKLGTVEALREKLNGADPIKWAEEYVQKLTQQDKEGQRKVKIEYSPIKQIPKGERRLFSAGYLFLQKIYHELRLDKICQKIEQRHKFDFDLDSVLSRLVYGRILFPASKLATCNLSKKFLEPPNFEIQHIYRGLAALAKETDFIQAEIYKNSTNIINRKTGVLYYDCTNYFFEIEQEEGLKQYGYSKEHRPNPIVQMGLFMDGDGMPLAFSINKGNTNEQTTLKPLEKKILSDFELSKFIVCTDAGLSSIENRKYNSISGRAFITTQSVKKLVKHLKEWALGTEGWLLDSDKGTRKEGQLHNISEIDEAKHKKSTFYKERWIKEKDFEQKLIVTSSLIP